jgi:hypothetical protein
MRAADSLWVNRLLQSCCGDDSSAERLRRSSPLFHADRITKPSTLLQGAQPLADAGFEGVSVSVDDFAQPSRHFGGEVAGATESWKGLDSRSCPWTPAACSSSVLSTPGPHTRR